MNRSELETGVQRSDVLDVERQVTRRSRKLLQCGRSARTSHHPLLDVVEVDCLERGEQTASDRSGVRRFLVDLGGRHTLTYESRQTSSRVVAPLGLVR